MGRRLTLGLDIGPTSVGWAVADETDADGPKILKAGVRIFPEGVDRDQQGGEKSKNQARRIARGMRRQIDRRARRKRAIRNALIVAGLLPRDPVALQKLMSDQDENNPYSLRKLAVDPSHKLSLEQIGRVILHFATRRGFLSNRKSKTKDDEEKGLAAELTQLDVEIQNTEGGTLGAVLAERLEKYVPHGGFEQKTPRKQHTRRDQHQAEFLRIWKTQSAHHPKLLTNALLYGEKGPEVYPKLPESLAEKECLLGKYGLFGIIYFQRKMYWPKSIVGRCELEPKEKRCPRADRAAQLFRILQEVNNLRILDRNTNHERSLLPAERRTLVDYLSTSDKRTFDQIRKKLKFHEQVQFNLERAERDKLDGHKTDAALASKKCLGKRWYELSDEQRDTAVTILLEEERDEDVLSRLLKECNFTEEEAIAASRANLPDGYASYSRKAILKLLPFLQPEEGRLLMANDEKDSALHAAGYLRTDQQVVNKRDFLPKPPALPNPIVRQAIYEVRKVVNAVLRMAKNEGDELAIIRVELVREAKKSLEERDKIRRDNSDRRRARDAARVELASNCHVEDPKRKDIERYLLWKEQGGICPYCGQPISPRNLTNDGETQVDHILPRWRSLDDSLANKVVCHERCNSAKGDHTPREWLEPLGKERYESVLRHVEKLPYSKQLRFRQESVELKDFVERQLRDTTYITRLVFQYLRCLGAKITSNRGQLTAELRRYWGLNSMIGLDGRNEKNRSDLRHHGIDAIVVALMDEKRLHALANASGKDVATPSAYFHKDVQNAIYAIRVSHRARRKIVGKLHEATLYGPTQKSPENLAREGRPWAKDWIEDGDTFVRRKFVEELTDIKHLEKIRDPGIRTILKDHLRKQGIATDKGKIPSEAFKGVNTPRMPSGVPIKRVRMLEESETFRQVSKSRSFQFVKPGNNHHIKYIAIVQGENETWRADVVTMWDVAKRWREEKSQRKVQISLVDRSVGPDERFVMSLSMGEMFEIEGPDGEIKLCVVRKIDQRSKRVYYKLHTDGREAGDINKDNLYLSPKAMQQANARKVTVDALGNIYWAND